MDSTSYEQFRDEAIKRLVEELRTILDRTFEIARQDTKKPSRRLVGLKDASFVAMNQLAQQGFEDFNINDVLQEIQRHDYQFARAILLDPAKKASLSSLLRRLAEGEDTIKVDKVGEGRRATQYRFVDEVLARAARESELS
jgi:predicted TIM-barrel fold metal-dependent hydrolase